MKPRTLKTEADYKEALAEVDSIFDATLGTPEGDRLDILTLLVEAYEEQHFPIHPPNPAADPPAKTSTLTTSKRYTKE